MKEWPWWRIKVVEVTGRYGRTLYTQRTYWFTFPERVVTQNKEYLVANIDPTKDIAVWVTMPYGQSVIVYRGKYYYINDSKRTYNITDVHHTIVGPQYKKRINQRIFYLNSGVIPKTRRLISKLLRQLI
jgi:hypothetical protein